MSATLPRRTIKSADGSRTAACWCASPGRGSPPATTTSCRCGCGAAGASPAAGLPGGGAEGGASGGRESQEAVPPSHVLDGFGVFVPPPPSARPVPAGFSGRATPEHPPGFYGPPEGLLAVNALAPADQLVPLNVLALNAREEEYGVSEPQDLRGPVLLAALGLLSFAASVVFVLAVGGGQMRPPRSRAGAGDTV